MMADIKTRSVNKGNVKTIDRAANLTSRIRSAEVRTKDQVAGPIEKGGHSETQYANDNMMRLGKDAAYGSARIIREGAVKMHRAVSTKEKNIDIKTKVNMIRKSRGVSNNVGLGRKMSNNVEKGRMVSVANAESISKTRKAASEASHAGRRSAQTVEAAKRLQQSRKLDKARRSQLAAKKTVEKTAKEAKKTAKLIFKAVRRTIMATKTLVSAIAAGGWVALIVIIICTLFGAAFYFFGDESSSNYTPVSPEVEAYTPLIQKYANQYGIGEYVELIKAVMMQESGGRGTDPMQCSESPYNKKYSKAPGSIKSPEYSIDCGVHYLADCLSSAKCKNPLDMDHIRLALQGYNYGNGYIPWAIKRDGGYTVENASAFSDEQAKKHGWKSYGDKQYVAHVLRYYPYGSYNIGVGNGVIVDVAAKQIGNKGGKKFWSWYGYSSRVDWCAIFVSWCADQCGYIKSGTIPKFAGVPAGVDWFKSKGQFQKRTYKPAPGDIIFIDWGGDGTRDHVGIVEKCDGKTVYTIEGNSGDACKKQSYRVDSPVIYGYGVPKY